MPKIIDNSPEDFSFTEISLLKAVGHLLEMNNYSVEYGTNINGAEIDIIAKSNGDPFTPHIYIEATIQYVENIKYGKDLTKFAMVREFDPAANCVCVSSKGFTAPVKERAGKTRIHTFTYSELFAKFEKFAPYVDRSLSSSQVIDLVSSYEKPHFRDSSGEHVATNWLDSWKSDHQSASRWLIVLGEYGTGKTSLTYFLRHIWLTEYKLDPQKPIPVRIELRNFTRQFDTRSLLHHFLDTNYLSHIPIEFMVHLIRTGRVILLLDGYDEMAQFLNARERRACLTALAELSADGARGILTSRPNYFTEAEELSVFDALYTSIEKNKYFLSQSDRLLIENEKFVDDLLGNYIVNKKERYLRDLDQKQTESLVKRKLIDDPEGQKIILNILSTIFRDEVNGSKQSLGGKPVIVSFLLELIDELRGDQVTVDPKALTEWQVYKLIVDRLMIRDLHRSPGLDPELRRQALQKLALVLSKKETASADEDVFIRIIDDVFKGILRRLNSEDRRSRKDELFQDLRSSATLTRMETGSKGWHFSHNSLREYLVSEGIIFKLFNGDSTELLIPISDAMRSFVASVNPEMQERILSRLHDAWVNRSATEAGAFISLCWEMLRRSKGGLAGALKIITGSPVSKIVNTSNISISNITIDKIELSVRATRVLAQDSSIAYSKFSNLDLKNSFFDGSMLDNVSFKNCSLNEASFKDGLIFECEFENVSLNQADFRNTDKDINFAVRTADGFTIVLSGLSAIGYIKFMGGLTDDIDPFYVWQHHPKFPIVIKICENIQDQKNSQLRGLTQRGVSQSDPVFARAFVKFLERQGLIYIDRNYLVSATQAGRKDLPALVDRNKLPSGFAEFLGDY